jgi:hypothetical protein
MLKALFIDDSEISIQKIVDRQGQTWYCAYDPQTHQTQWFTTEAEILAWLDSPIRF